MEPDGIIDLTGGSPSLKNSARHRRDAATSPVRRSPRKHSGSTPRRSPHKKSHSNGKSYQYTIVPSPLVVQMSYNPYTKQYKKPTVLLKSKDSTPRFSARRGLELEGTPVGLKEPPESLGLKSAAPIASLSSDLGLELMSSTVELKKPPELRGSASAAPAAALDVPAQKELPKVSLQDGFPTVLYVEHRQYNRNYVSRSGDCATYRCKNYRSKKDKPPCKGAVHLNKDGSMEYTSEHHVDPWCALSNKKECDEEPMVGDLHDATDEMMRYVDYVAIAEVTATADNVARQCLRQIALKYGTMWTGLNLTQLKSRVQNTRTSHGITGTRLQLEQQFMSSRGQCFFRSQKKWIDPKAPHVQQEVWTFAKHTLLERLKNKQLQVVSGT